MSKVRNGPDTDKFFKKRAQPKRNGGTFERHNRKNDHAGQSDAAGSKEKKFFDKKTYRMKKYSNKYKLDQWEENRRKTVLKKYYKDIKNDPQYGNYKPFNFDDVQMSGSDDEKESHDEEEKVAPFPINKNVEKKPVKEEDEEIKYVMHPDAMDKFRKKQKTKNQPFRKAQQELSRLREDRIAKKEAALKAKQERTEALAQYKLKKSEKFKKLSKRTRTGQPLMKDRMQMLLENIQQIVK